MWRTRRQATEIESTAAHDAVSLLNYSCHLGRYGDIKAGQPALLDMHGCDDHVVPYVWVCMCVCVCLEGG